MAVAYVVVGGMKDTNQKYKRLYLILKKKHLVHKPASISVIPDL